MWGEKINLLEFHQNSHHGYEFWEEKATYFGIYILKIKGFH